MRQLREVSGYSQFKIAGIISYWLERTPQEDRDLSRSKYLIYDGSYFHKNGCLISLMDAQSQRTISHIYAEKEGYKSTHGWFLGLREAGLYPVHMTMDGEQSVMRAIHEVWPKTKIQRCLYHIQREGMRWLRTYPKTEAGRELRALLKTLCRIKTVKERDLFIVSYARWLGKYRDFVRALPRSEVAFKDLNRTMALIYNALPDMFHYLDDSHIPKTTNTLESFYSRLKADYRKHRGLSERHKISYLTWYCHFNNHGKTNIF